MKRINRLERLAKKEEKAVVRRIFFLTIVSFVLIIFAFTQGISILGKFADILDGVFKGKDSSQESEALPSVPVLDPLPPATNSDNLTVSGFTTNSVKVEVWVNGEKSKEVEVSDSKFKADEVRLTEGENIIAAKSLSAVGAESDFSQELKIVFDKKEPELEVRTPTENQNFSGNNKIKVEGKTEENVQIFANGFLANVDSGGEFDVTVVLADGENTIEVKAVDEAGNVKELKIKVVYHK